MAVVKRETKTGEVRYDVRLRRPDGRTVNRTFKTLRTAEQYEREQLHARDRGAMHDPSAGKITFAVWVDKWRSLRGNLRPSTLRIYEHNLARFILPTFGDRPLSAIRREDVRSWLGRLPDDFDLSPGSVHQAFRVLRTVLAAAVDAERIVTNPAAGRGLAPKLSKSELRIPTPNEVATLADSIDPRYRALVLLAAYCGLRRGELAGLRWEHVDLLARRLRVVEQLDRSNRSAVAVKTDAAVRTVPVPRFVVEALNDHQAAGYSRSPGLVFTSPTGGALDVGTFRSRFLAPAMIAAGLDGLRLHDLRHTCASTMIASGADLKRVQEVMGHSSATLTLDTYGHLLPDRLDDLADRMDAIGRSASPARNAEVRSINSA